MTVDLLGTSGTVLATTTTDSSGAYSFTGLSDGQYLVEAETTETFTQPGLGTTSLTGSVFDPGTGMTAVTISGGQAVSGLDAGLYTPVTIEGNLFVDAADAGYFVAPDAMLTGDTITLENSTGATLEFATSASDGSYEFSGLAPGSYQVAVGQPVGYQFTTENATGDPSVDSGVDASTGISSSVTLTDGASAATINAGLLADSGTASISGTVTTDASGASAAASGLTVQLTDPATGTMIQTTTTDTSGDYSFSGLTAGTYAVTVESGEIVTAGRAFDPSTSTATETVTAGQALSGVDASLAPPEQMTFSLEGYSGTISFSLPLNQGSGGGGGVLPLDLPVTVSSGAVLLSDFSITIGSQTFNQSNTSFSTAPTVTLENGEITGLTFAFDATGSSLPYSTVSMSGGTTLSARNVLTSTLVSIPVTPKPSVTLDFSGVLQKPDGKAGMAAGELGIQVTSTGNYDLPETNFTINCTAGLSGSALVQQIAVQLEGTGLTVTTTLNVGSAHRPLKRRKKASELPE